MFFGTEVTCNNCGMTFGVPERWNEAQKRTHATFYCPNGHNLHYPGKSDLEQKDAEIERLREDLKWKEKSWQSAQKNASYQFRRAAVYKGKYNFLARQSK